MNLYAEHILDHYRRPRGQEALERTDAERHEVNASCGDDIALALEIADGKIVRMHWRGTGCAISQAAVSMLSEALEGMAVAEAEALPAAFVYELLAVPIGIRREKCALLCLHALKNALHVWKKEPVQGWVETMM